MTLMLRIFRSGIALLGSIVIARHPPDDGLVEAEIAAFGGCQFLGAGLSGTQASDIGAPSAEMWILLSSRRTSPLVFDRTQNKQALHVDTAAGGGRSSAISRRMSANSFRGMATSAIWNAT